MFHFASIIFFIISIWASYQIFQSLVATKVKVIWILFILIFPLIGLVAWYFLGPGNKKFKLR